MPNPGESQVRNAIDEYLITGKTPPPITALLHARH